MLKNPLKKKIAERRPTIGLISNLASAQLTEIFGIAGFDFIIFDMEHGAMTEETLEQLVRAAKLKGLVPLARARENNAKLVQGILDAGCLGVLVPQVETKEEAQRAVNSAHYSPRGNRGINWKVSAAEWGNIDPVEYIKSANENILTMIQIETAKGVENIKAIVEVDGIDVIAIGPADLSGSMGYPGNPEHAEVKKAIDYVMIVAQEAGIPVNLGGSTNKDNMADAQNKGATIFVVNPAAFITGQCKELVSAIRKTFIL